MNPYLNGIMALSQLTPEQFDTGMQRFEVIQGMQPQRLSALQARQSGLTGSMVGQAIPQGPATFGQSTGAYLGEVRDQYGNVVRPAINPSPSRPEIPAGFTSTMSTGNSSYYHNPQTGESFSMSGLMSGNPTMSVVRPAINPPRRAPIVEDQYNQQNVKASPQYGTVEIGGVSLPYQSIAIPDDRRAFGGSSTGAPLDHPTMSPFSSTRGSFGTGAMPYTQPYYQRSFNPYAGGYGMGFGGGMPSYGGFGGGMPSYGGFGGGQQMYGGFGGGKGGGRPSYGGGKGGRGY